MIREESRLELLEADVPPADAGLFTELALGEGATPPTEFRIFKAGENRTRKGVFLFEETDAKAVMAKAKEFGADYSIDYGHSMFGFALGDPADTHAAAGWFRAELRSGELWATDVTWTPKAAKKLSDREYRYTSPTFNRSEDGHISELLNVALTGVPATNGLKPLVAAANPPALPQSPGENMDPKLLALLGLAASATLPEVLAAIETLKASVGRLAQASATESTLLSLTGKPTTPEALGVTMAWKDAAEKTAQLAARVQELEGASKVAAVKTLLETAVKAGKVAPAQVPMLTAMGGSSFEQLKAFVDAAPAVLPPTNVTEAAGSDGVTQLTAEDMKVAALMGTDPKKLAALRLADRGIVAVGELTPPADA